MPECFIALGANLSNPKWTFMMALTHLQRAGVSVTKKSGLWKSPAWPLDETQPDYTNAVIKARFAGTPEQLMDVLLSVEKTLGRVRSVKNAARTIDLDLLTFDKQKRSTEALTLPHPRMKERAFVLLPLCDIDPAWVKPARKLPKHQILSTKYIGSW